MIYSGGHLLGDWGGLRTQLNDLGITPDLTLVTDIAGNPTGGHRRGVTEASNLGLDLQFDLGKIAQLNGGTIEVSMSDRFGSSLSKDYIGNTFNVQQDFGGQTFKLIDAALMQNLAGERVQVRIGRIAAGDDFLVSTYDYLFMQNGLCGNPVGIFLNSPGMTAYPNANWGTWLRVRPTEQTYIMAGVFNGDPISRANDRHGVDFSFKGPLFAIAEAGYQLKGLHGEDGMVGNYKVGMWYDDSRYVEYNSEAAGGVPTFRHGNTGFYGLFDQALLPLGDVGSGRGVGVFGSLLISPDQAVSQMPYFATVGVAARGLLDFRPNDACGFAVIYGKFSGDLTDEQRGAELIDPTVLQQDSETAMELTYRAYLGNGSVFVQPDLQYIVTPGGTDRIPDALVVGCQIGIDF